MQNRQLRDTSDPFQLPESNFMHLFRVNKPIARYLCDRLTGTLASERRTAVPIVLKIFTGLFFFAHGSYQKCVGSNHLFGLSQPSVSRCIKAVSTAISDILSNDWIKFPVTEEEKNDIKTRFYEKYNLGGIIGCIDCTHVAIVAPPADDPEFPGLAYINRKGYHSINVQVVCDSNLKIVAVNARYPGSVHDAAIWYTSLVHQHLRQQYEVIEHIGY